MKLYRLHKLVLLFIIICIFASCKKELSCENCQEGTPPIANAGVDQTIILPGDSIALDGSASTDPDGKINEWLWTKISGPSSFTFSDAEIAKPMVKALQAGIYQFELKVVDDDGLAARDTVQVTVDDPASNQPPLACAGTNQTITLPGNTADLNGSCSADSDNNITAYLWTKVSGPSTFNINNASAVQTQVTGLTQGVYQFELKVTDAGGLVSKDTVQVTVNNSCDVSSRPKLNATLTEIGKLSEARIPAVGAAGSKIVFAGGDKEFVCGPDYVVSSATVDIYDVNTKAWATAKLSKERSALSVATADNKIFFAGGVNWDMHTSGMWNVSYNNVDIYDVSNNTWSLAHLGKARSAISVAVVGNKVLFAGGIFFTDNPLSNLVWDLTDAIDIYDISTNSWSTAKLSVPRSGMSSIVIGDKAYFAGGNSHMVSDLNVVDIYNSSTNTWSTSNLPEDLSLKNSFQLSNYLVWMTKDPVRIKNTLNGNVETNCLSSTASYATGLKDDGIVFFPQYMIPHFALTQFDYYNTTTKLWSVGKLTSKINGTATASVITANNTIYLGGGVSTPDGCTLTYYDKVYTLNW